MSKFTLDTPLNQLLEDEQAAAIIKETLPMVAANPMVKGLPIGLRQIAGFSGGALSPELLSELEIKLNDIG